MNLPIELYSLDASNAILDGRVFFDFVSPMLGGVAGAGLTVQKS
jgi:hypothetical protein